MVFSSAEFLFLLLPVTAIVYFALCRSMPAKNICLLAASLFFYAWGEPLYVFLMLLSILVNWFFGRLLAGRQQKAGGRRIVAAACIYNLGILFIVKYLVWILGIFGIDTAQYPVLDGLSLPIGISFYTFQALSYVIDVCRGRAQSQKNLLHVGLYIAFFPQLIAGPIVQFNDIAEQIHNRTHSPEKFCAGLWRFAVGLAKKMILSNQLASLAEVAFGMTADERSVLLAWLGALAYTLQIFFDFSGYSDMAIGLAKMFGFELKENFNYPYRSRSVTEFWKRWHISLTTWFREYLYFPLGGNRCGRPKWLRNFFLVWFLTGLWHGANLTFIVWGLAQGVVAFFERLGRPMERKGPRAAIGFLYTFVFTILSWTMFNSADLSSGLSYYASMFGLAGNAAADAAGIYWLGQYKILLVAGVLFCFPVIECISRKLREKAAVKQDKGQPHAMRAVNIWNFIKTAALIILFLICCAQAIAGDYNPFIYFNF